MKAPDGKSGRSAHPNPGGGELASGAVPHMLPTADFGEQPFAATSVESIHLRIRWACTSRSTGDWPILLPARRKTSRRLQALLFEQAWRLGRHEFQQRRGDIRLLRRREHARREGRDLLQRVRQRADNLDAGDREKFADLL